MDRSAQNSGTMPVRDGLGFDAARLEDWMRREVVGFSGPLSVEQFRSSDHRTHKTLLSNAVVIVEGMVLSEPPPGDYELYCLPMLLAGLDGAPARAVLIS